MGLLRTIAILLIIYYALKLIGRYIFPLFVKRTMSKMEDRFREQQQAQEPQGKVGDTTIEKKPKKKSKTNSDKGEYIDYEEVD